MAKTRPLGLLLLALVAPAATAAARETVDLIPAKRASWTIGRLFAPITGLFLGGPSYWYGERILEIETQPPGARLDLSYVRDNIQRRFERAESPIRLRLPSRIDTGAGDSVAIRAILDGYLHKEVQVEVRSRETQLTIDLAPLPNRLVEMTHTHLARRGSLRFSTTEATKFRLQEMSDGFSIVLPETDGSDSAAESMRGVSSDNILSLRAEQLGEDLVVRVRLRDPGDNRPDLRSTRGYDTARELHQFTVELVPAEGNPAALARATEALDRIRRSDVSGCALEFDRSMRAQLDSEALARALAARPGFLDSHLQSALQRLGELSPDGWITLVDGSKFRPSVPLDLEAARAQSAEAVGFLSLLRAFVAELEPADQRRSALRSVIAPEVGSARFDAIVDVAEQRERQCGAQHSPARS